MMDACHSLHENDISRRGEHFHQHSCVQPCTLQGRRPGPQSLPQYGRLYLNRQEAQLVYQRHLLGLVGGMAPGVNIYFERRRGPLFLED